MIICCGTKVLNFCCVTGVKRQDFRLFSLIKFVANGKVCESEMLMKSDQTFHIVGFFRDYWLLDIGLFFFCFCQVFSLDQICFYHDGLFYN